MRRKIFAICLLVILVSFDSSGYTVSGKITTTTDTSVQCAMIRFVSQQDTSIVFTAITNSFGEYVITLNGVSEPITVTQSFQLHQNYPNPFSEQTTISYSISEKAYVTVTIYDILGRKVKSFQQDYKESGRYSVEWDGKDAEGKKVAYGVYLYRITSSQGIQTKKMVYVDPSGLEQFIFRSNFESKTPSRNINLVGDIYTVYIDNTDSTQPRIDHFKEENVIIMQDTALDFKVVEAAIGNWQLLGLETETVTAIAVHPTNPCIIYAGSAYDFSAGHLGKLFKSTNSGKTWDTLLVGQPLFMFRDIAIDPIHPETVYTIPLPVLKSTNGGKTWFEIINGIYVDWETRVQSLVIDPLNTNILYCGTGGFFGGGFYKSTNGGKNWIDISRGDTLREGVVSIAIDPGNSNIIYAGTAMNGRLWKTTDAGDTWTLTGLGETSQMINDILINPINSQIIFAGISEIGIWKTEDGGNTWFQYNNGLSDSIKNAMKIIMRRTSSELFLIHSTPDNYGMWDNGGIYKKSNDDEPWLKIGINNLRRYYYSDIKLSNNENMIYFGSQGFYSFTLR